MLDGKSLLVLKLELLSVSYVDVPTKYSLLQLLKASYFLGSNMMLFFDLTLIIF